MTGPALDAGLRIERDAAWWTAIARHPALGEALMGLPPEAVGALCRRADMLPLAATHGGFLFARDGALGFTAELHTLFTPAGWGREAARAGRSALSFVFAGGVQLVTTFEVAGRRRSRPPVSFGFSLAGDWRATPLGPLRLWSVSGAAWSASPAGQRHRRTTCP